MTVDLLLGLQWGDEGKGKIVDVLTSDYDVIARFQGGPNAGHTLEFDGHKHVLHTIPSGIFHDNSINIIGNGVVIDPVIFKKEIDDMSGFKIDFSKKLFISRKAHLILPTHRLLDAASEIAKGKAKIGSTLKGIGPTYMDKTGRNGLRVGDIELFDFLDRYNSLKSKHLKMLENFNVDVQFDIEELEKEFFIAIDSLKELKFIDSEKYLSDAIKSNKTILAEGAQGTLLDVDFGTYPFVTSSTTTAAGACTGLGVSPRAIGDVIGIFKAYVTRVGSGPFPTELFDADGEQLAISGNEFGSTTGRARRTGWLDLVALKYACEINGVNKLYMMKADVLSGFNTLKVCTDYKYRGEKIDFFPYNVEPENVEPIYTEIPGWKEDLTSVQSSEEFPETLNNYVAFIEKHTGIKIEVVSVGPDRLQTIYMK